MPTLLAFPVFIILAILQSAVLSRMPLLHGTADLTMLAIIAWALRPRVRTAWQWCVIGGLLIGLTTALSFGTLLAGYLATTTLVLFMRRRVWRLPILAMFVAVFAGTVITQGLSLISVTLTGTLLPLMGVLNLVVLPSLLLNLLLAVPIYAIIGDLADRFYPEELEG